MTRKAAGLWDDTSINLSAHFSMPNSPFFRKEMPQQILFPDIPRMYQRFRTPSKTLAPIQHQEIWRKVPPCQLKGYQVVLWIDGKIGWTGIGLNATSIQAIPGTSFQKLTGINTQCFFRDILGTVQGWIYHASLASTWHKSLQSLQYGPMLVMWSGRIQNTPDSPLRPCALSAFSTAQTSELIRTWVVNRQRWSSQFLLVYFIWLVIWISISVVLWWFYDISGLLVFYLRKVTLWLCVLYEICRSIPQAVASAATLRPDSATRHRCGSAPIRVSPVGREYTKQPCTSRTTPIYAKWCKIKVNALWLLGTLHLNTTKPSCFQCRIRVQIDELWCLPIPLRRCPKGLVRLSIPHHSTTWLSSLNSENAPTELNYAQMPKRIQDPTVSQRYSQHVRLQILWACLWHIVKIHSNKMHPQLCKLSLSRKSTHSTAQILRLYTPGSDSVYMCLQCHGSTSRHLSLAMLHFTLRSELSLVKCLRTLRSEAVRIRTFFSHFFELSLFHHMFPFTLENLKQKGMWTQDWSCTPRQLRCFLEFLPSCQPRHKWILPLTEFSVILQQGTFFSEGIGTIENVLNTLYHISSWQSLTSLPLSASSCAKSSASRSYVEIGTLWVC